MRKLYTLGWCLALPLVLARLWWRGRKESGYRQHWLERLGFYGNANLPKQKMIWLHAVSLGETRAAEPLIHALLAAYPDHGMVLTHMTPTGRAAGKALCMQYESRLLQAYLPYDISCLVERFITHYTPSICILMETEVWPNVIATCNAKNVPLALVNARLSARSLAKAQRSASLMLPAARGITCVAAQTMADAERLQAFGALNVQVTGNLKFDVHPPQDLLKKGAALRVQIGSRPVLLCASTREGEEALILDALPNLDILDALLVIVPRHPQRFDEVARMIAQRDIKVVRRSILGASALDSDVRILLGDSMGELFAYYAACDIAFIGGSLLPFGGQNLIEACAVGKPVLIGLHTFNFAGVSEDAIAADVARRVLDAADLLQQASYLIRHAGTCNAMGYRAVAFSMQHRGATARTVDLLQSLLE